LSRTSALAEWLAGEIGGRVTQSDLRTGWLLRRTYKVVASRSGPAWECYVSASAANLWINNLSLAADVGFSLNRASPGMLFLEPLEQPFARLPVRAYVRRADDPGGYSPDAARAACRRFEPLVAALDLRRGELVTVTPTQLALWGERLNHERLRARLDAMTGIYDAASSGPDRSR
jgi:hypothetical protein